MKEANADKAVVVSLDIVKVIDDKLAEVERREGVRVLYAVESGSRAWGFASPDSDYDVRFIYVHPREHYLRLEPLRDVIEWQLDETLDISGWDLQKALRLAQNANPTFFEWSNSPVVYRTTDEWQKIKVACEPHFNTIAGLWHYVSMAKSNYRMYLKGETVRLKKYLYVIRPLLACRWILDYGTPPPMLFSELLRVDSDESLQSHIARLLELKTNAPEKTEHPRIEALNDYIEQSIPSIEQQVKSFVPTQKRGWDSLNEAFLCAVQAAKP